MPRINLISFRQGTAALWTSTDPILAEGEPGFEKDTNKMKVGDGANAWSSLPYITGVGGSGGPAIAGVYANIAALLADQGSQDENAYYWVTDASADATVDSGWAIYRKLAASTGAIGDYVKVQEQEGLEIQATPDATPTVKGKVNLPASVAFGAALTFDHDSIKYLADYDIGVSGNLTLTIAATGHKIGTGIIFRLIADGVGSINFGAAAGSLDWDLDARMNVDDGEILLAGNYDVILICTPNGVAVNIPQNASDADSPPIAATYGTIAALFAAQGSQTTGKFYKVSDATGDATVQYGTAVYEKLGTSTSSITDYRKDRSQESLDPNRLRMENIGKAGHGLAVGDVLKAGFVKVTDPDIDTPIGIVEEVIDANTFGIILTGGYIQTLSGLTDNALYYVQSSGVLGTTPTSLPYLIAIGTTGGITISSSPLNYSIKRQAVAVVAGSPNTLTLDMEGKAEKKFLSGSISSDFTMAFSNTSRMEAAILNFTTSAPVDITMPGSVRMPADANWTGGVLSVATGRHILAILFDGTNFDITLTTTVA